MPRRRRHKKTDAARSTFPTLTSLPRQTSTSLIEVEDRRQWHPERDNRPALNILGRPHRLMVAPIKHRAKSKRTTQRVSKAHTLTHRIAFQAPQKVLVCVRRQQRKEVLHAHRKTGRGTRKPRRTWRSDISCR